MGMFYKRLCVFAILVVIICISGCSLEAPKEIVARFVDDEWGDLVYHGETYSVNNDDQMCLYLNRNWSLIGYVEGDQSIAVFGFDGDDQQDFLYVDRTSFAPGSTDGLLYSKNKLRVTASGQVTAIDLRSSNSERITDEGEIEFLLSLGGINSPAFSYDITHRPDPWVARPVIYYERCPLASSQLGHIVLTKDREWAYIPNYNITASDNIHQGFLLTDEGVAARLNRMLESTIEALQEGGYFD